MVFKAIKNIPGFTPFQHVTIYVPIFEYFSQILHIGPVFSELRLYLSRRGGFSSYYGPNNTQKTFNSPLKAPSNFF